ncbi:MAG TPA: hypothetical protein VIO64_20240 [Pseudobacteroides sp.]|uniref:hypothetical protein n=1 Tax=Pseudobacteroides sp. TaxID=1968840 RepID=UPI002F92EFCE
MNYFSDAVYSAINELLDNGYIEGIEIRKKGNFTGVEYKVSESKISYMENKETDKIKRSHSVSQASMDLENKEYFETERYSKGLIIKYGQMIVVYNGGKKYENEKR